MSLATYIFTSFPQDSNGKKNEKRSLVRVPRDINNLVWCINGYREDHCLRHPQISDSKQELKTEGQKYVDVLEAS